jgi:hypothetical protein
MIYLLLINYSGECSLKITMWNILLPINVMACVCVLALNLYSFQTMTTDHALSAHTEDAQRPSLFQWRFLPLNRTRSRLAHSVQWNSWHSTRNFSKCFNGKEWESIPVHLLSPWNNIHNIIYLTTITPNHPNRQNEKTLLQRGGWQWIKKRKKKKR